jgi:hypothetical protein
MKDALQQLWTNINSRNSPLASLLQPGLPRERIDRLTSALPFRLAEDIYQLYMWRNGTSQEDAALGESAFIPGTVYYFMALEEAIEHYLSAGPAYRQVFDHLGAFGETIPMGARSSHYFAILYDGILGEFLVPGYPDRRDQSIVLEYVRHVGPPKVAFPSIKEMIHEVANALNNPGHRVLLRR